MASYVQDGGQISKQHGIFPYFYVMRSHFVQQHESGAYFVKLVENGRSIQNGGPKSGFLA
jgi:hypothetical protein